MDGHRVRGLVAALVVAGATWASAAQAGVAPQWNHDPADLARGPLSWAQIDATYEACATGASQSPVDVGVTTTAKLPVLRFRYPRVDLTVENTGHVIEVPIPPESEATLRVGHDRYRLVQFHFHAPSEHRVNGRSFDMEAHLVHRDPVTGQLAVVGVFLDEGTRPNALVDFVIANAPAEAGEEHETHARFSAAALLPAPFDDRAATWLSDWVAPLLDGGRTSAAVGDYVTYGGSLTTPPCSEGVRWFVLEQPGEVSSASVERHHEVVAELPGYDGFSANNRPTRPLNGRTVLRSR